MRRRLPATVEDAPLTVIVFTGLALVLDVADWVVYYPSLSKYPLWNGFWFVLALGGLAAIVVWRQEWAWWLGLLSELAYVLSPAWGARLHPISDALELLLIGLLVTPSMRRYVGVLSARRQTQLTWRWLPSPGLVCLSVSGAGVLAIALEPRHPSHHAVSFQVVGYVVVWLVVALVLRVALAIVQWTGRLARRRGGTVAQGR
jgi:hypothetical protein